MNAHRAPFAHIQALLSSPLPLFAPVRVRARRCDLPGSTLGRRFCSCARERHRRERHKPKQTAHLAPRLTSALYAHFHHLLVPFPRIITHRFAGRLCAQFTAVRNNLRSIKGSFLSCSFHFSAAFFLSVRSFFAPRRALFIRPSSGRQHRAAGDRRAEQKEGRVD